MSKAGEAVREVRCLLRILPPDDGRRFLWQCAREFLTVARTGSFRSIDDHMSRSRMPIHYGGRSYLLLEPDFALVREIFARNRYLERHGWCPAPGRLVIDLGANTGLFTLLCAKAGCDVVAVEAQSGFLTSIEAHLDANACRNRVDIVHALVAAWTGVFAERERLQRASHYGIPPRCLSMNEVVSRIGGRVVDLLKIDIEGSEFALFEGKPGWLERVERISMEVHPEFGSPARIAEFLRGHGFRCTLVPSPREACGSITRFPGYCFARRS